MANTCGVPYTVCVSAVLQDTHADAFPYLQQVLSFVGLQYLVCIDAQIFKRVHTDKHMTDICLLELAPQHHLSFAMR